MTVARTKGGKRASISARLLAASALMCAITEPMAASADTIPTPAAAAGYRLETLAADSFSPHNVDKGLTYARGFQWFYFNFEGMRGNSSLTTFNSDGSVTLADSQRGWNGYGTFLTTAGVIGASPGYRGTAYGGGGYFEATLSFNPSQVNINNGAWPAWWSMSIEHMISRGDQWVGQRAGYEHFVEPDFFEYDISPGAAAYGGNVHDWWGVFNSTCPGSSYCNYQLPFSTVVRRVPTSTNFNQYHRYGMLWIPATATTKGSFTYYFDGAQIGAKTYYSQFTNQPPPPGASKPWTFGIIDQQHVVLIIGTGPPVPMRIRAVQVWQKSAAGNLRN